MTKKEFDRLTKESMGKGAGSELRHIYKTRRGRPSGGTTALAPNEFFGKKQDKFHAKINKRKPLQHAAGTIQRLLGSGRGNSRLRQMLFEIEHPLPGKLKYEKGRLT